MKLFKEIHRRSLWQILGLYLAGGWISLQVVDQLAENAGLPDWVPTIALIALVIGLPIVLATAFVQQGAPVAGLRPTARPFADPEPAPAPADAAAPTPAADPEPAGAHHRLFTWKNATLVAQGVIEERAPILVADFEGADEELANTATDALRIDLSQSRVVSVVEPTEVGEVLRRMEREADAPLTLDLAREIAEREGIPVVVAGELDRAGEAYVVSARLIQAESGEVLVSARERAANAEAVLDAIDDLSATLRERIGESIRLMNREEPLAQVTTSSLEALRKYSQAIRAFELAGDDDRAISLLDDAVRMDTAFAMAWRKLGTLLANRFVERERSVDALTRAFEHRDRLTERERYQVEGIYNYNVLVDIPAAITAYENILDIDPQDDYALNNLGVLYGYLRENERSREYYELAIAADSTSSLAYSNAATMRLGLGRYDDAREMMELFSRKFPDNPDGLWYSARLASATGEYEEAEALSARLLSEQAGNPVRTGQATSHLAAIAAIQGRLDEARRHFDRNLSSTAAAGVAVPHLNNAANLASVELGNTGDRERALAILNEARSRFPLDSIPALNRPYALLAMNYALAGALAAAAELLAEFEANVPPQVRSWFVRMQADAARAEIALAEGRFDEALVHARKTSVGFCLPCDAQLIARIHDAAGASDSATVWYRRYRDIDWFFRGDIDQARRAPFLERLAQLYDESGDLENAAKYYAEFVELWAEADAELQPRVAAAQARLQEIVEARG